MTNDQVFVPKSRSQLGLPPLDPSQEDILGSHVSEKVMNELWDALGDSPIGAVLMSASYLVRSIFCTFPRYGVLIVFICSLEAGLPISFAMPRVKYVTRRELAVSLQITKTKYLRSERPILDFNSNAVMFKSHQYWQIVWSNAGVVLWLAVIASMASRFGVWQVLTVYVVPYLWCVFNLHSHTTD